MDLLSFLGLGVAFGAILVGQHLEGGHLDSLINGPAFLIVIGGTIGAIMLQSPMSVFLKSIKMLMWVFFPSTENKTKLIE